MIKTKRNSLELFLREQMLGPGACMKHFVLRQHDGTITGLDSEEVLNTTPGSVYSTGILFPQRIDKTTQTGLAQKLNKSIDENVSANAIEENDNDGEGLEEILNRSQSDEEDVFSLSQRFPTTIGISCCLDKVGLFNNYDIKITVSGRYYWKIPKSDYTNIIIRVSDAPSFDILFSRFKEKLSSYFVFNEDGLSLRHDIEKEGASIKDSLLEINQLFCKEVAQKENGSLDEEYLAIGDSYRYLKSYKERLWRKLRFVKDGITISEEERNDVLKTIEKIENYETFLSYFDDALSICSAKSFGYWISDTFCKTVDLSDVDLNSSGSKIIFSPRKIGSLKDIVCYDIDGSGTTASLSLWVQVMNGLNESSGKKYLKIQVENTSSPFEEDESHYFSIVTEKVNQRSFFGIEVKIESPWLCPYQDHFSREIQGDIEQLNYLYRSLEDYGIGHLCSVNWKVTNDEKWVKSEFLPSYETPDVEAVPRDKQSFIFDKGKYIPKPLLSSDKPLQFKWLSTFSDALNGEIVSALYSFVDSYKVWIEKYKIKVSSQFSNEKRLGENVINDCLKDYERMRSNIELLLDGCEQNILSFRIMNSAMFMQLWHGKNKHDRKSSMAFYREANDHLFGDFPATWRPFQLAFILLNLDGIIQRPDDATWSRRNEVVDLVWFPTGGGKTEAYLGIIALAIIHRRRNESNSGGTTAIMRYTLRLLATQQFQRAMRVILALEQIRQWDEYSLGDESISIGLYVGDSSLPNKASDLYNECLKWNELGPDGRRKESRIPIDRCPFCGRPLKYVKEGTSAAPKIKFRCDNIRCEFSNEIPVKLCDEYIYEQPPTLLFGTVDKFAALGHKVSTASQKVNQDSRRIFGKGLNNFPPSLIIQDELHLLLGPLGSAVSLFECAIDQLCSYDAHTSTGEKYKVRPKIISSTATTRNTNLQIKALYDRDVNIFPKSGIDYDDSFFSFYKREKELFESETHFVSKRKYLGILPTGRTQMTTQMRLVATMFVHRALFELEYHDSLSDKDVEETFDYYHSIIDYFNSLKEVGKTDAQFFTEFTKYTRRLFKRVLRNSNMLECLYCYDSSFKKSELTGRLSGSEVVKELSKVGEHWKANLRFPTKQSSDGKWIPGSTPPDMILATNMISVGLDVDRFNTIIMNSMPRNVAEYIQASSRVARSKQGLVVTLHNPFRMRDLSHFERFIEFHEKLYYYVEPISITPFSKKSIERYLPLYLATMIRHNYPFLANPEDAASLTPEVRNKLRIDLCSYFKERLTRSGQLDEYLRELLTPELETNIESFIDQSLSGWMELVNGQSIGGYKLRYSGSEYVNKFGETQWKNLFICLDSFQDDNSTNAWAVPISLRTVESEAVISVKEL